MSGRRCVVPVVLAVLLVVAPAGEVLADKKADPQGVVGGLAFRDLVEVTVVNLDVYVRGKDRQPVTGLQMGDFRVLQNGYPKEITHFAPFTEEVVAAVVGGRASGGPPVGETSAEETPFGLTRADVQPVHLVLYVDNENIQPLDRARVLAQLRRFVDQLMYPHVRVTVISGERSVRVLQPFTDDPALVREALRSMGRLSGARVEMDGQRREIIGEMQRHVERGRTQRRDDVLVRSQVEGRIRSYGEQLAMEVDEAVTRLREAALMVAGLPGRKVMVYVSSGLPMVPAKDLVDYLGTLFEQASTLPMLARFDRSSAFRSLAATANAQGLSFYTLDATGLAGSGSVSAEFSRPVDPMVSSIHVSNLQDPLVILAEGTGGRATLDANDVTRGMRELQQDLFTYYSVGYTIGASGADVVHHVEVQLPNHPQYRVLHRRTFVERSRETEVQAAVATSLVLEVDDNPMGVELVVGAGTPVMEDRYMVPVEVAVPVAAIALVPEGDQHVGRAVVFVATRDAEGRQSDIQRLPVDLRFPSAGLDEHLGDRHVLEAQLLMRPGGHRIAVGVLDVVTRQASFTTVQRSVP